MTDHEKTPHSLVPVSTNLPTAAGEQAGGGILKRMTQGALQVLRARQQLAQPRHRVGEYELCEPDYRQLLLWSGTRMIPLAKAHKSCCRLVDTWSLIATA